MSWFWIDVAIVSMVCVCRMMQNRRCASRDSTNQNASFVEWFSRVERAVFRGICGEIFALFHVCVGNFDTIPPWKVVGTLHLDSSCVSFLERLWQVWIARSCESRRDDLSVIFALLLGFIAGYCFRFYRIISYNLLLQPFFFVNFGVYPGLPLLVSPLWGVESVLEWRDCLSQVPQIPGNGLRNLPKRKPTWSE